MTYLVWFKQDLRIHDNPALHSACKASKNGVIGLYLITPNMWKTHDDARIKIEFWRQNLAFLKNDLEKINIPLIVITTNNTAETIEHVIIEHNIKKVFFNKNFEPNEKKRDHLVCERLAEKDIGCELFLDQCILEPGSLLNKQGKPYTIFTPFKKSWINIVNTTPLKIYPKPEKQKKLDVNSSPIPEKIPGFETELNKKLWPAGESAALRKLTDFIESKVLNYKELRDIPSELGTSNLSPYLTAGVLSVKQCLTAALNANQNDFLSGKTGVTTWVSELIWREFYRHIMVNFPKVGMNKPFKEITTKIKWSKDEKLLMAWKQGKTGIPIVDAAMRQLNTTGWMHNRLRMVAAMFLTKNCFIDWREGEKYFMQHLIDGDLASNNGGWQWSASTGTDAAPYFRIMSPIRQSQRFDPEGNFIKTFCPELSALDNISIHAPYDSSVIDKSNLDYPTPIVHLNMSRQFAIERFKLLKNNHD